MQSKFGAKLQKKIDMRKRARHFFEILSRCLTSHVLAGGDAGFVFEHAREMMWVIEAEHVCRFADAAAAHKDILRNSDDIRLDIFLGRSTCRLFHQVAEITC